MTDVPLYTAVISACAAVAGAAIPTIGIAAQSALAARRERRERAQADQRQACVELVQAAENLRTQVADNHDYHGDEMGDRLARVRAYATQARVQAVRISLMASPGLAESGQGLAAAASRLAEAAEATTDLQHGASTNLPDFGDLESCMAAFKAEAVKHAKVTKKARGWQRIRPAAGPKALDEGE